MTGRREIGRSRATRALVALVVAVTCLGGVAYATTRSEGDRPRSKQGAGADQKQGQRPPRPRFTKVPPPVAVGDGWRFRFHIATQTAADQPRFQCRLDGSQWKLCSSPRRLGSLSPGDHAFAVRALNRRGLPGPAAHYRWSRAEPKEFTIEPLAGSLEELMPGAPAQQLPVRIENPNPAPIEVTSLTVSVTPAAPSCPGDPNFAVTPSNLSPASPLTVPAAGSAELPTATVTAPTLALRELPVDQDACQGTTVRLDFVGNARG